MTKTRIGLALVVCAYGIVAMLYSLLTPLYEVSDELWHYPMMQYMANNALQLPPQDLDNLGAWRQEGSQPPLYYMLAAILTSGIDTSDMDSVRRVNPHSDIGIIHPDGNVNMMTHTHPINMWQGTALATYISRWFSVVLGALTIIVTFYTARELFPQYPELAWGATIFNAFLPMYLFISGSVNNDNLSNLLGNLLILLLIRLIASTQTPTWRSYVLVGIVTGAGILSKLSMGFLIPLVALVYLILSIRLKDWKPVIIGGVISGGLTIVIAGWWYWHNYQTYGDPTGLNRFLDIVGRRPVAADLATVWAERDSFTQAFWGFFGGMNVVMPQWIYQVLNIFAVLGMIGAIAYLVRQVIRREWTLTQWLMIGITLFWIVISLVSYTRWTSETIASQGRLIFGALSVISLWLVWGVVWFLPTRLRQIVIGIIASVFVVLGISQPFMSIAPVYALPPALASMPNEITFREPNSTGVITLGNIQLNTTRVQPASYVEFSVDMGIENPLTRNWSIFVHLIDESGVIIGQRDVYPGGGLMATSDLAQGRIWNNSIAVFVPNNAYTPNQLTVVMGWYDLQTGERLVLEDGASTITIGQVSLEPRPSESGLPNAIGVNFGNLITLAGYEISDISPLRGDTVELTLYWQAQQPISTDYVVFANILEPQTLTKYASSNAMPANWTRPTSTWQVGEIITDTHTLAVDPNAPQGIYEIELGLYVQNDAGEFLRLAVIGTNDNFVYLTRVRILENTP
jgi:4-amino-4-deoxy-L-arabinose transferase-like glycosyltransferase